MRLFTGTVALIFSGTVAPAAVGMQGARRRI
jgi:hypothetical protein